MTVNGATGDGTMRLDLNPSGTGIASLAGVAIASGFTGGATYSLDDTPPVVAITSPHDPTRSLAYHASGSIDIADASLLISVFDGTNFLGSAKPDPVSGLWSVDVILSGIDFNGISAKATDAAGNVGSASILLSLMYSSRHDSPDSPPDFERSRILRSVRPFPELQVWL